jgi:hypothetical protein
MTVDGKSDPTWPQMENKNQDGRRWQIRTKMAANGKSEPRWPQLENQNKKGLRWKSVSREQRAKNM